MYMYIVIWIENGNKYPVLSVIMYICSFLQKTENREGREGGYLFGVIIDKKKPIDWSKASYLLNDIIPATRQELI